MDHVLARESGGGLSPWNLVPACPSCNLARGFGGLEARLSGLGLSLRGSEAEVSRQRALALDVGAGKDLARIWYPWLDAYRERQLRDWHARAPLRREARARAREEAELLYVAAFTFDDMP